LRDARLGRDVKLEGASDTLHAEEVVTVGGDLDLELVRLTGGVVGVGGGLLIRRGRWEGRRRERRNQLVELTGRAREGDKVAHVLIKLETVLERELVELLGRCKLRRRSGGQISSALALARLREAVERTVCPPKTPEEVVAVNGDGGHDFDETSRRGRERRKREEVEGGLDG
jgi:hypothetical protein